MKKYRIATGDDRDKHWRQPQGAIATVGSVTSILREWGNESSRIKKRGRGEEFSRYRRTFQTGVALLRILPGSHIGDYFLVQTIGGHQARQLAIRAVDVDPPLTHTDGTDAIDRIYTDIMEKFHGKVQSWGICSCRDIGSTSTISQHAYCNAWDLHASPNTMEEIFHYLINNADRLHVHTVIYNHRVWSRERPYIHPYVTPPGGSSHEDHVHVDPDPQSPGRPC